MRRREATPSVWPALLLAMLVLCLSGLETVSGISHRVLHEPSRGVSLSYNACERLSCMRDNRSGWSRDRRSCEGFCIYDGRRRAHLRGGVHAQSRQG